jgi:acetylornithine deacetylase/succinyl-diaminopimelate desuccinylase-like protein
MCKILPAVQGLSGIPARFTDETRQLIEDAQDGFYKQSGHEGGPGSGQVLRQVTVNIGTIKGGSKVNIVPGTCEVEVDVRLPLGITWAEFGEILDGRLREVDPSISWEHIKHPSARFPASYTSMKEEIFKAMKANATQVMGVEPLLGFTPGGNDCRYYRARGIPAVVFGPTVHNEAAADEYVLVDDLMTVTKVHVGTIIDYQAHGSEQRIP